MKNTLKRFVRKVAEMTRDAVYLHYYYGQTIDNKMVLLESKHGSRFEDNMFYLAREIHNNPAYQDHQIYITVTGKSRSTIHAKLKYYDLHRISCVRLNRPAYLKVCARAKFLFNDTSFGQFFIKKEGQVYTNTWHGTPWKLMGDDDRKRAFATGNIKRNLLFSDYLLFPSKSAKESMVSAYGLDNLYQGNILEAGYPRNAVLFDSVQRSLTRVALGFEDKCDLEDKKVIIYMPTWRSGSEESSGSTNAQKASTVFKDTEGQQVKQVAETLDYLDKHIGDRAVLYASLHPLAAGQLNFDRYKNVRPFPAGIDSYELLNSADVLITDYSSVLFDFANTGKKIILYIYDLEHYSNERGFYYPLSEMPFAKARDLSGLVQEIKSPKNYDDTAFREKFNTYDNLDAAKDLIALTMSGIKSKSLKIERLAGNGLPNTLVYVSSMPLYGITTSVLSLMRVIDNTEENFYFSFRQSDLVHHPERIERLPKDSGLFPLSGSFRLSFLEIIAAFMFFKLNRETSFTKKYLDRMFARESLRFFGGAHFDRVVQFVGYERWIIGLFQRMDAKTVIFVHNDMLGEIKLKKAQHSLTLQDAYRNYHKVAVVSEAMFAPTQAIRNETKHSLVAGSYTGKDHDPSSKGKQSNEIVLVENALDFLEVIEKSNEDISFDPDTVATVSCEELKSILNSGSQKFINIARFSPEKGQLRLIDAFAQYLDQGKNIQETCANKDSASKKARDAYLIIIGGRGDDYDLLLEHASKLNCTDRVILILRMSNPYAVLARCDLFILASLHEGLGLVLLEAAALGIPCISTDIAGTRQLMLSSGGTLVQDSQGGLLQGMNDFDAGKVATMNFDFDSHNAKVADQYKKLFE